MIWCTARGEPALSCRWLHDSASRCAEAALRRWSAWTKHLLPHVHCSAANASQLGQEALMAQVLWPHGLSAYCKDKISKINIWHR